MPNGLYTLGWKPQYGKTRWSRYESLRIEGFTKSEARELSRLDHPDDKIVIASLVRERRRFIQAFENESSRQDWSEGQRRYRFYRGLRNWYVKQGYLNKGNPVMAWYHKHENAIARRRGWQKGTYDDPSYPEEERVMRRTKRKTPPGKGKGKGQVKAQRSRAKLRAYGFRHGYIASPESKVNISQVRDWIRDLRATVQREPERRVQLTLQIERLEKNLRVGRR